MYQELHEILEQRSRLRVASIPLALGLSLGLHLLVLGGFLAAASQPRPRPAEPGVERTDPAQAPAPAANAADPGVSRGGPMATPADPVPAGAAAPRTAAASPAKVTGHSARKASPRRLQPVRKLARKHRKD
jgi:hypothetical protein